MRPDLTSNGNGLRLAGRTHHIPQRIICPQTRVRRRDDRFALRLVSIGGEITFTSSRTTALLIILMASGSATNVAHVTTYRSIFLPKIIS